MKPPSVGKKTFLGVGYLKLLLILFGSDLALLQWIRTETRIDEKSISQTRGNLQKHSVIQGTESDEEKSPATLSRPSTHSRSYHIPLQPNRHTLTQTSSTPTLSLWELVFIGVCRIQQTSITSVHQSHCSLAVTTTFMSPEDGINALALYSRLVLRQHIH